MGGRSPRLAPRASAPPVGHPRRAREGAGDARRRLARRTPGGRDRRGRGCDRRRGPFAQPTRARRDDRERLRLRRLRGARVRAVRRLPPYAHGLVLRQARPEAVPARARRFRARGRERALRRRLPARRPGVHDRARARRPGCADRPRAAAALARAPARERGAAPAHPRGRRPRTRSALRQGVRVHRRRAADSRDRAAGRCGRTAHPRHRRRRRRGARRRGRHPRGARRPARALAEGGLDGVPLAPEWREQLSRGRRVEQLADLLRSLA